MPIQLDNLKETKKSIIEFNPKFFDSSKLTGKGGKAGLLNDLENPTHIPINANCDITNEYLRCHKQTYANGPSSISIWPFYLIREDHYSHIDKTSKPPLDQLWDMKFSTKPNSTNKNKINNIYCDINVHSMILEEVSSSSGGKDRILKPCYKLSIYIDVDGSKTKHKIIRETDQNKIVYSSGWDRSRNTVMQIITRNPRATLKMYQDIFSIVYDIDIKDKEIEEYINSIVLYTLVCKESENWQKHSADILDEYLKQMSKQIKALINKGKNPNSLLNSIASVLAHIETYPIPLQLYQDIYKSVSTNFTPEQSAILCKQNLNMLLSDTLHNLDKNRKKLTCLPKSNKLPKGTFSQTQINAITETDPLVLVQAGAGTGKSTLILGRIDYMTDIGINPSDITVLSFTNAAADNITAKNPQVNSMTIAKMVHLIYSENFPTHDLSTVETIINSLDIYYPKPDNFIIQFRECLKSLIARKQTGAITKVNNFLENNYDQVINTLNTIKQTALELQILICYQNIGSFKEPAEVQSKYLIIDEVQDNSIFEFVYVLKYVEKHNESLFIVGDCSQTLYEFRASNPKALNVLEGSGIFSTHQLQINYRSNQEILDFANILLSDIDANQYANIQLKANSLNPVTPKSFKSKVNLNYKKLRIQSDLADSIPSVIVANTYNYIKEKLDAGEKVAILGYARNHIYKAETTLTTLFPDANIGNLIPNRMTPTTYFSTFIKQYWNEVKYIPPQSIMMTIAKEVLNKATYLVRNIDKQLPHIQKLLAKWRAEQGKTIDEWQKAYENGILSEDDFYNNIKENMMKFEISNNAIRQALLSARNQENKKENGSIENADIILSTIHSAKGLEFDNVIILYESRNDMSEEKKRMYYVALTRAMKSELILAFDTIDNPKIQNDYATIIRGLNEKAKPEDKVRGIHNADGIAVIIDPEVVDDDHIDIKHDISKIDEMINEY